MPVTPPPPPPGDPVDGSRHGRGSPTDEAWGSVSTLIAGLGFWGVVGWLVDRWLGTFPACTAVGVMLGMLGAIYLVIVRTRPPG